MQAIELKNGFRSVLVEEILKKISIKNEYIFLENNVLSLSFNLDVTEMYDSPFGENEKQVNDFLKSFERNFPKLDKYFAHEFEIVYFAYNDEYSATMWKFEDSKLLTSSGWIGDFCNDCSEADDEDEARNEFVDNNYPDLKEGNPSEELLEGLRSALS